MKVNITVCDICKNPTRPVQPYLIALGTVEDLMAGRARFGTTDRCAEDAAELEAIIQAGETAAAPVELPPNKAAKPAFVQAPKAKSAPTKAPTRRTRITTMDEIEAQKRR